MIISLLKIFLRPKEILKRAKKFLRGLKKDPFCYFWLISLILFGILNFSSFYLNKNFKIAAQNFLPPFFNLQNQNSNQVEFLFLNFSGKTSLEVPSPILIEKNSLKGISPPLIITPQVLAVLAGQDSSFQESRGIIEYLVEPGDNLWLIADKFNITLETLLWANNLNKNSKIQPGQKLVILPVSGVIHYVRAGDTISEIAQKYQGKISQIITFNNLIKEDDIFIGDILIIPDGKKPYSSTKLASQSALAVPLPSNYFIYPTVSTRISQGLHWYNAVDFDGRCGDQIFAAAAGTVLRVKLTESVSRDVFGGAGNHLTILHPNGTITMYGHLLTSFVNPGDRVSQGQIIALMGGQPGTPGAGTSTGCHLHFEVRQARNPFVRQ